MKADSDTIHDAIQTTQLPMHNNETISHLLDICEALNRRIDLLESKGVAEVKRQSKRDATIAKMLGRDWDGAIATFHALEARTAELLAEKAKQSP